MATTEVVKQQVQQAAVASAAGNGQPTVFDLIKRQQPAIELALPKHLSGDRFARIAMTLVRSTPKLLQCEPMSFIGALMVSAQLGLEPGPPLGQAWIIPRYNSKTKKLEATWQIGYKGVADLFRRSGQFKSLEARAVCENDEFDYAYGLGKFLRHKPALSDRGPSYAWYALAEFKNGGSAFVVLGRDDVERRRGRGEDGPAWRTDYDAMASKSCVMALAPWLPLSPELERALATDNRTFTSIEPNMADVPALPMGDSGAEMGDGGLDADDGPPDPDYAPGEEPFA